MFSLFSGRRPIEPFSAGSLDRLARTAGYPDAQPFPHLVLDDFFNPTMLDAVLGEWPRPDADNLESHNDGTYVRKKLGSTWRTRFGPHTRSLFDRLAAADFLEALEQATSIWGLVPDPYLWGGGLHFTQAGGRLAIHADFNKHFKFNLDRRLNLLLYLNRGWTEANGGWLELWNTDMAACGRRVLPVYNRMVIFSTTDTSFHGQPEEIVGPPDLFRRSIALYYYTNGRPACEVTPDGNHSTLWRARPNDAF